MIVGCKYVGGGMNTASNKLICNYSFYLKIPAHIDHDHE